MKRSLILTAFLCAATVIAAQGIRDMYETKADACLVTDTYNYRETEGYMRYGQIGWERETGWRPIQYLDRYKTDHSRYNVNSFLYCQVVCGDMVFDDCEIVAFNSEGNVVGNQCPEPKPLKAVNADNTAIMAIFGNKTGEEIRFMVVTGIGTDENPLDSCWAKETLPFSPNSTIGLIDSDKDGKLDTWQPMKLTLDPADVPMSVLPPKDSGVETTVYGINGLRKNRLTEGINIVRRIMPDGRVVVRKVTHATSCR